MLAYRHAFHAGNHADVLKHWIYTQVLAYMGTKDKPYWVIDTHAGAGGCVLTGRHAVQEQGARRPEYLDGIGRLWEREDLPATVRQYVNLVRDHNPKGDLRHYPGSPALAMQCLREQDRLRLFELHPADVQTLGKYFGSLPHVEVHRADGFSALKSQLPPPSRRALVLIDPPYELKADYAMVVSTVREALKRFSEAVIIVWYPLVARLEARQLPQRLKACAPKGWLHAQLNVQQADARGVGLMGSGVFIANPPWTLHDTLKPEMPWLAEVLAQKDGANWLLEQHTV